MKFWLLDRGDEWMWDEVVSVVVRAEDEQDARWTAAAWIADSDSWHREDGVMISFIDPEQSTCTEIPAAGESKVVHDHLHYG